MVALRSEEFEMNRILNLKSDFLNSDIAAEKKAGTIVLHDGIANGASGPVIIYMTSTAEMPTRGRTIAIAAKAYQGNRPIASFASAAENRSMEVFNLPSNGSYDAVGKGFAVFLAMLCCEFGITSNGNNADEVIIMDDGIKDYQNMMGQMLLREAINSEDNFYLKGIIPPYLYQPGNIMKLTSKLHSFGRRIGCDLTDSFEEYGNPKDPRVCVEYMQKAYAFAEK